jgi:hypothetical protein
VHYRRGKNEFRKGRWTEALHHFDLASTAITCAKAEAETRPDLMCRVIGVSSSCKWLDKYSEICKKHLHKKEARQLAHVSTRQAAMLLDKVWA